MESGFQQLMHNVASAGWGSAEIAVAIEHLAMADRRAREENAKVDATLRMVRMMSAREGLIPLLPP